MRSSSSCCSFITKYFSTEIRTASTVIINLQEIKSSYYLKSMNIILIKISFHINQENKSHFRQVFFCIH